MVCAIEGSLFHEGHDSWLAAGEGALWAAYLVGVIPGQTGVILRIDPATRTVTQNSELSYDVTRIAAGEGAVWAVSGGGNLALRIDPATLQLTDEVPVRWPSAVATGGGAAWVTSYRDGTVIRIDPVTTRPSFIEVGGNPTGIAAGEDAVWVTVSVG